MWPLLAVMAPAFKLLLASLFSSIVCIGHASMSEPINPQNMNPIPQPLDPPPSQLLKSSLGRWIHGGDVRVQQNPSAPNLPSRQRRVSFQVEESLSGAGTKNRKSLEIPKSGRAFVIQETPVVPPGLAHLLEREDKQPLDSFLDEVIKNVPVAKPALYGIVKPALLTNNTPNSNKTLNISKSLKVIGEEHPMELGKVKIRPAHVVLSTNDTLLLECFAGYNTHASVSWTLNDRVLLEVDESKIQTIDYKGVKVMVSSIFIHNVLKLPTFKEIYVFKCIYLFDDEMQTAQSVVHARVTDDCQNDHDCAPRNARCVNSRCACTNTQFPVKLQSVHTTCRVEAFLETECLYDEQCENVEPKSECTVHHWCACIHGYARDAWSNCLPKTSGLRTRCNSDRDCIDLSASCVLSHCTCIGELEERSGRCISKQKNTDDLLKRSLVAKVSQGVAHSQRAFALSTVFAALIPCILARLVV